MLKKIITITLSVILVFSLFAISASADKLYSDAAELAVGESATLVFFSGAEELLHIKFVADKTMTVEVKSSSEADTDPYCTVYDSDNNMIASADDTILGLDFNCRFDVTEGEIYYIEVCVFNEESVNTLVSIGCGHSFTDAVCDYCTYECTHTEFNDFGECYCGQYYGGEDIVLGENSFVIENGETKVLRFVPEEDGIYVFISDSEASDPYCALYNFDGEYLTGADDGTETYNFEFFYIFEKGESYLFEIGDYYQDAEWIATFEKINHDAEHSLYYEDINYGTCQETGYSAGVYCEDCEEYVIGHNEIGYGYHSDDDIDGVCDYCGEVMYEDENENPTAIDNLFDFFISIIQFFKNLFLTIFGVLGIW